MTAVTITRKELKAAFKSSPYFKEEWRKFKKILDNKGMEECLQNVRYMLSEEVNLYIVGELSQDPVFCLVGGGVAKKEGTTDYYHVNEYMQFHGWAYDGRTFVLYYEDDEMILNEETTENMKKYLPFFDEIRDPESSISKISGGVLFE